MLKLTSEEKLSEEKTKMKLVAITILAALSCVNGFSLNCAFTNSAWPTLGVAYTCRAQRSLRITAANQYLREVTGTHVGELTNADVMMVNFDDLDFLETFPRGLADFFPNLQGIRIYESYIVDLVGDELSSYPNLKWFSFMDGEITRVPGNFFAYNPDLVHISFYENYIRHVGENLFASLYNVSTLEHVDFRDNRCISQRAVTPGQVPQLIDNLLSSCPDIPENTPLPPGCEAGDTYHRICALESQVESLTTTVDFLNQENYAIRTELEQIWAILNIIQPTPSPDTTLLPTTASTPSQTELPTTAATPTTTESILTTEPINTEPIETILNYLIIV